MVLINNVKYGYIWVCIYAIKLFYCSFLRKADILLLIYWSWL